MARRQDPAGRGGPRGRLTPAPPLTVLVHDRREALAALALAAATDQPIELAIPVGIAGPAFARALEELLARPLVALCDDRPGLALEALRAGLCCLAIEAAPEPLARLADIAGQLGGTVRAGPIELFGLTPSKRGFAPLDPAAPLGSPAGLVP